jgi:hypothetical protein
VNWPDPRPGLVIRYSYLGLREAEAGREEGVKDRPCAVVIAIQDAAGRTEIHAAPITHSQPRADQDAIELPAAAKARLGLDAERSWIVVDEANIFGWPGPDLRFLPGKGPESAVYGFLPPAFFALVRERFLVGYRTRKARMVTRTE